MHASQINASYYAINLFTQILALNDDLTYTFIKKNYQSIMDTVNQLLEVNSTEMVRLTLPIKLLQDLVEKCPSFRLIFISDVENFRLVLRQLQRNSHQSLCTHWVQIVTEFLDEPNAQQIIKANLSNLMALMKKYLPENDAKTYIQKLKDINR
ncbi:MAG: hypothetical protein MHPSP_003884 [Paramarteilia canceri]